ncbi:hypothetical protein BDV95DRAFT_278700 [Massariosphaeria phaeospora]|uniref:F-box domain-containing protein n=1 Tax=Massariosphaeria phaeospora TaxID=100035 RepID=A0A7C8ILA3_9PLEO|nr:hypothetical protein BDV95DRAFT_278700 [Massariosphaeria phaeospora]
MECTQYAHVTPIDQVPIWLLPIVEAARALRANPQAPALYTRLRTLQIRFDMSCSPAILYLFCLPRLRLLHVDGLAQESTEVEPQLWPVSNVASDLEELQLTHVEAPGLFIAHMIRSCKALSVFKCHRVEESKWPDAHMPIKTADESRAWCAEIMSAVEQHSSSLTTLELEPHDTFLRHDEHYRYAPLDSFKKLDALDALIAPFMLLMGTPSSTTIAECTQTSYLRMLDVLPPNLVYLCLSLSPWTAPGAVNETILDLKSRPTIKLYCESLLQYVHLVYDHMKWNAPLPLQFWKMKDDFAFFCGISFDYLIHDAIDFDHVDDVFDEQQLNTLAKELARHGPMGIEMATHFSGCAQEMKAKVMDCLGLDSDWLLTEEGQSIMFVELNALDEEWRSEC